MVLELMTYQQLLLILLIQNKFEYFWVCTNSPLLQGRKTVVSLTCDKPASRRISHKVILCMTKSFFTRLTSLSLSTSLKEGGWPHRGSESKTEAEINSIKLNSLSDMWAPEYSRIDVGARVLVH